MLLLNFIITLLLYKQIFLIIFYLFMTLRMLTSKNNNSIRIDEGGCETQCESHGYQEVSDEIRRP